MKRFLAIGLAASLALSGCLAAYGDEDDYYEESEYEEYEDSEGAEESDEYEGSDESGAESAESAADPAGQTPEEALVFTEAADVNHDYYTGMWVDTGVGLKLWLPEYWEAKELSEDAAKQGLVFRYGDSDGMSVSVTMSKLPKAALPYTLDDFFLELKEHYGTVQYAVLNGISCLIFEDPELAMSGFAAILKKGYTIVGVITPPSKYEWSDYQYFINNIIHSVSESDPVKEEAPAAEAESGGTQSGDGESGDASGEEEDADSGDSGSEDEEEDTGDAGPENEEDSSGESGSENEEDSSGESGSEDGEEDTGDAGSEDGEENTGSSGSEDEDYE